MKNLGQLHPCCIPLQHMRIPIQTTVNAAGGSRSAAVRIARALYVKLEEGTAKEAARVARVTSTEPRTEQQSCRVVVTGCGPCMIRYEACFDIVKIVYGHDSRYFEIVV